MSVKQALNYKTLKNLIHGYRVLKVVSVPEFQLTAVDFIHEKTKCRHLHLAREDNNKVFAMQFRTTPRDSTGVAHILEHTVLCGSHRFPVRDPFFKMLTRSMATFMNAFTASDWTMYPFSTLNEKDYYNLLHVYMDAVLKPRLDKLDFLQEGWRLEPADLKEPQSPLQLKGVVYNEMKGVFSSASNIFAQAVENNLMPLRYGVVSGGHPASIPSLTWEALRQFHQTYYHPSNAKSYSYGDLDVEKLLQTLNADYLSRYSAHSLNSAVDMEPVWDSPRRVEITCPPDPMAADPARQCMLTVSYLLSDIRETYTTFVLSLLSRLLMDGETSPFYQHLLESGLGLDWAGGVHGYDASARTTHFSVGLQGVREEDLDKIEPLVMEILESVAKEGFPQERIDAALHQIELSLKHDSANFGLKLIMALSSYLNHDVEPENVLQVNENLRRIRADLASNKNFLQKYVQKYFLENRHRLVTMMRPQEDYVECEKEREKVLLQKLTVSLTDSDKADILKTVRTLEEKQSAKEDISCLPCLQEGDLSKKVRHEPFTMESVHLCSLQLNAAPTNGIVYVNMVCRMDNVSTHLLPYVPLFTSLLTQVGAGELAYREFSQAVDLCSGGLGSSPLLVRNPSHRQPEDALNHLGVHLCSHGLNHNVPKMLRLWKDVFTSPRLDDTKRIVHLIQQEVSGSWSSNVVASSGHAFAMRRAAAVLDPVGRLSEHWSGLEQALFMQRLAQRLAADEVATMEEILEKLKQIANLVLNKQGMRLAINSDNMSEALQHVTAFLDDLPEGPCNVEKCKNPVLSLEAVTSRCHFQFPFSVFYTSKAMPLPSYTDPEYAKYRIMASLLSTKYLHKVIREKGGAYGGGVSASPGVLQFYSYRDPRSHETLAAFEESLQWVLHKSQGELTQQDLLEAKLAVFQKLDAPVSAGSRGLGHFLSLVNDDMRQQHRDALFRTSLEDVCDAASKLTSQQHDGRVVLGPQVQQLQEDQNWDKCMFG